MSRTLRPLPLYLTVALALLAPGCAGLFAPPAGPGAPRCFPVFPYQDGWLGGDAAYSVPLGDGRSLWLFGDTFVASGEASTRRGATFIHNSIGISDCERGVWSIEYHWQREARGARDFLDRGQPGAWWWLFDGFRHDDALYLGLLEVESTEPRGPLGMPFGFTGVSLARIRNFREDVSSWQVERVPLSRSSLVFPAGAMVEQDEHIVFFAFVDLDASSYPRVLARLPRTALDLDVDDLEPHLEWLSVDGTWTRGLDPADARVVMDDDATEMSVVYRPELERWLALYAYPTVNGDFPASRASDRVWVRTARALEGPWSEPHVLYRIPELDPEHAGGFDPNTACYAAKEHAQFARPGGLTFTYVCNLFAGATGDAVEVLGRLADDLGLYRPIGATVTLPAELGGPGPP